MKGKTFFILLVIVLINTNILFAAENFKIQLEDITAPTAILIEANTGQVLFQKNIHKQMKPASTIKLLTALIIVENHSLDEVVTIKEKIFTKGSRIYLRKDEQVTVEQLLNALLVESANDAAIALARYHSGSEESFAEEMNERAKTLGALNSNFLNPNGLDIQGQVTTAYDMALIAKEVYQYDTIKTIVKKTNYSIPPTNIVDEYRNYLRSSNWFLTGTNKKMVYRDQQISFKYEYVTGMKTGYTPQAGQCLVTSAKKGDRELIAVVFKSKGASLYPDSRKLIDYGFYEFEKHQFYTKEDVIKNITLNNKKSSKITLSPFTEAKVLLPKNYNVTKLSTEVSLDKIKLPLATEDVIGYFYIYYDDKLILESPLHSNIPVTNATLLSEKTNVFAEENSITWKTVLFIFLKFVLAFLIWRTIITVIRIYLSKREFI